MQQLLMSHPVCWKTLWSIVVKTKRTTLCWNCRISLDCANWRGLGEFMNEIAEMGGPSLWAQHIHLPTGFIQNHTRGLSRCWSVSGNLTPTDLRWTGHSGLSGRWQMTQQQRTYCCHNMTTSLSSWPSLWPDFKTVNITDVTPRQNLNSGTPIFYSVQLLSLICLQALSKTNSGEQILHGWMWKKDTTQEKLILKKTIAIGWPRTLPQLTILCEITEILSTVFQNKVFSDLQDPVTDVAFVPMQIKPLILSFSLGFAHKAGEKPKLWLQTVPCSEQNNGCRKHTPKCQAKCLRLVLFVITSAERILAARSFVKGCEIPFFLCVCVCFFFFFCFHN